MKTQEEIDIHETTIYLLIKQAKLDNRLEEIEVVYIQAVANSYDIDLKRVMELEDPENFNFSLPQAENKRMAILYHLLFLSKKDLQIDETEINFIQKMGFHLGIREEVILELIEVMKKHIGEVVPSEALLAVFKPYLN